MKEDNKRSIIVPLLSISTLIMGLIDISSAITPALPQRLVIVRSIFPYVIRSSIRIGTAMIGLLLIFLSNGLRRRKKVAWYGIVLMLGASLIFYLVKGFDIEEAIITTALLVALIYERGKFVAKPDVPSLVQGFKAFGFALFFTFFYGTIGLFIIDRRGGDIFAMGRSLATVFNTFFLLKPPPVFDNFFASAFFDSIYLIGFCTIIFAIYMFFRPVVSRKDTTEDERNKARKLFEKYGRNFAAEIMLLPGRSYFFNKNDNGFIVYKPVGSFAVVMTEPICDPKDKIKNTMEFVEYCTLRGWVPVFGASSKEFADKAGKTGLKNISIGRTAIINLENYDFAGSKKKPLRYSVNVMEKSGYRFNIISPPISPEKIKTLKPVSDYWLKHEKGEELHFTVGYFDKEYIGNSFIAEVKDQKGKIAAFANFYEYGDKEIAIDLMRHNNCPPDTMLYLFTKLIIWAKENGYKKLNLGLVLLYGMGGKGTSPEEKTLKVLADRFGKLYGLGSLYIFKSKFQPEWEPSYLVYPSRMDLTGALVALIRVK